MSATFVAEILVGGVLTITWLGLFVMAFFGGGTVTAFLGTNPIGSTAILGVYAYALGVIMDRLWDRLTKRLDKYVRDTVFISDTEYQHLRAIVLTDEDHRAFFDYIRSRIRITRSCLCCFPLIGISGVAACWLNIKEGRLEAVIVSSTLATALIWISYLAFLDVTRTYYKEMKKFGLHSQMANGPTTSA